MSEMTDEERERRYSRFFSEEVAPLRAILQAPWAEQVFGPRLKDYGLGILQQEIDEASRRKGKDPQPEPPQPEPKRQKIQRKEEQGNSQPPPEPIQGEQEQGNTPRPEPIQGDQEQVNSPLEGEQMNWPLQGDQEQVNSPLEGEREQVSSPLEGDQVLVGDQQQVNSPLEGEQEHGSSPRTEPIQGEQEQGSSQPPPPSTPTSEQAKVQWVTFPREQDNPSTWIADEYGEWRSPFDWNLPPYYRDPDPEAPQYFDDMAEFYLEAARRLPIAQMPKLAGVISRGGLLLGFNDPVTNIIVNAIYLMGTVSDFGVLPPGTDPVRHAADKNSYVDIARRSRAALVVFMVFYFRNLTEAQAKRYLSAARHDLTVAVNLVEFHRSKCCGVLEDHEVLDEVEYELNQFNTDSNRIKTAVRYAARAAMLLRDPDDLVRLVASRYPCHLLGPALNDLAGGEQLSVGRVNDILNLLRHPWSPPPPLPAPTPGTFRDADGNVTIIINIGQDLFSTTTITKDRVSAFNYGEGNENGNLVTTNTISRHPSHVVDKDLAATAYLITDTKTGMFKSCLETTDAQELRQDMNLLMMCLLDTMHGFYIQALAMLPSDHQPRLLHSVLAAGHCFGVADHPVHNIIINSIWYKLQYLPPKDETVQIHHTRSITRIVSSSIHGLIAFILAIDCAVGGRISTEQEAMLLLYKLDRYALDNMFTKMDYLIIAAKAAKHPEPDGFTDFMKRLHPQKELLYSLMSFNDALSNTDFDRISKIIAYASTPVPWTRDLCQPALIDPDCWMQSYVRKKLEELLLNYGREDPLGPQYKLGIICGVASKIFSLYHRDTTCYHANFLASTGDVPESYPGCRLFFAEFWDRADDDFEQSKRLPVCCPIPHEGMGGHIKYHCRCFICESDAIRIVHPPDVNYFMAHEVPTDSLCAAAVHEAALVGMKVKFENRL